MTSVPRDQMVAGSVPAGGNLSFRPHYLIFFNLCHNYQTIQLIQTRKKFSRRWKLQEMKNSCRWSQRFPQVFFSSGSITMRHHLFKNFKLKLKYYKQTMSSIPSLASLSVGFTIGCVYSLEWNTSSLDRNISHTTEQKSYPKRSSTTI